MPLHISIVTPDNLTWHIDAQEVILPTSTGHIGILTGHAPILTTIVIGVMKVRIYTEWTTIVVAGGFAEMENDSLIILTNTAEDGLKINKETARQKFEEAKLHFENTCNNNEKFRCTQNLCMAKARMQAAIA
uniref:ATP synthase CF1 subunit epsilon n=1 Tax=Cryptomonas sp. CCAC 1634B TaxID=2051848 RepID=A0A679C9R6_9CRYP|nr:ATP synthase CF1 subunit epsilon [Cryptomonas sp. CCAC 1634B]